jgi:diamine N-acetyltransferase
VQPSKALQPGKAMTQGTTTIRVAEFPADIPRIQEISSQAWPATFGDLVGEAFVAHELQREYSHEALLQQFGQGHQFILLTGDEQSLGYASFEQFPEGRSKLHKLYLLPECKGKGYGKQLLLWVIETLEARGVRRLELLVNRDNPAVRFYRKMGFDIVASVDTPVGADFWRNDYRMVKVIGN